VNSATNSGVSRFRFKALRIRASISWRLIVRSFWPMMDGPDVDADKGFHHLTGDAG